MKRLLAGIMAPASLLVCLLVTPSQAQAPGPLPPVTSPERAAGPQGGRQHRAGWQQAVGLSPQQRAQVRPLQRSFNQQRRALRQQFAGHVRSILNPQQLAQLQQMRADARAHGQRLRPRQWQQAVGVNPQQRGQLRAMRQQQVAQQRQVRQQFFSQVAPMLSPDQQARLSDFLARRGGHRKRNAV